jgi:hypothetical protein
LPDPPTGLGHALLVASPLIGEHSLVALGAVHPTFGDLHLALGLVSGFPNLRQFPIDPLQEGPLLSFFLFQGVGRVLSLVQPALDGPHPMMEVLELVAQFGGLVQVEEDL